MTETENQKEREQKILVLSIDYKENPIQTWKTSNEFMVNGGPTNSIAHFGAGNIGFVAAMEEAAARRFHGQLSERAKEGKSDLASLVELVKEQRVWLKEVFDYNK